MNLFGRDAIIGDFKLSDYGLMLASFDSGDANIEDELGMNYEVMEEFIGHNPVPLYLGAKYTNKLTPQMTIIKSDCQKNNSFFTEHECREVLRQLTGFRGYKNMQILSDDFDELLYFNVRTQKVGYQKIAGRVVGIILYMECDSQFAWSKEFEYRYNINPEKEIIIFNASDDLYNYLLPKVTIQSNTAISKLEIVNTIDNNWTTTISNISAGELITMDSKNEILTSTMEGRIVMNDFNMHFIRLLSGKNVFKINSEITLTITYRFPRKVGFI